MITGETGNRLRILLHLRENPGSSIQDLADALGLTRTAANFHLHRFQREGKVESIAHGRSRFLFLPGVGLQAADVRVLGLLRLPTVRLVVQSLLGQPDLPWRELGRRLGITPQAVRGHIRRLAAAGLLSIDRQPHGHLVTVPPRVAASLGTCPPLGPWPGPGRP